MAIDLNARASARACGSLLQGVHNGGPFLPSVLPSRPCSNDVCINFGFFDPAYLGYFTQPLLLHLLLVSPPPPPCVDIIYVHAPFRRVRAPLSRSLIKMVSYPSSSSFSSERATYCVLRPPWKRETSRRQCGPLQRPPSRSLDPCCEQGGNRHSNSTSVSAIRCMSKARE